MFQYTEINFKAASIYCSVNYLQPWVNVLKNQTLRMIVLEICLMQDIITDMSVCLR